MSLAAIFDPKVWAAVPFEFWAVVFFVFGCLVGSFLNVCIHRMPLGLSVVRPPSHCPHCKYSIPWFLNIPLVTWLWLKGKCANCGAPISSRYFLVELLTGVAFLSAWLRYGSHQPLVAVVLCVLLAGFIVATFIDIEHFIIPDEITIGGIVAGFIASIIVPQLHQTDAIGTAAARSLLGIAVGGGVLYGVLRLGKLLFGRQKVTYPEPVTMTFTETELWLPDQRIPFGDIFYRGSDTIQMHAARLELVDRCYLNVEVRLTQKQLFINDEEFDPEPIHFMEATAQQIVLPREAMGFGDVKFMAAIGAFLGWQAAVFSLFLSAVIGAAWGILLVAIRRKEWGRLPYGPYIALAAVIYIFAGREWVEEFLAPFASNPDNLAP